MLIWISAHHQFFCFQVFSPFFPPSLSPALPFSVVSCVLAPTTFPLLILQRGNASLHMQLGSSQMHLPYRPLNIFLCCILIWLSEFFNNASYLFQKKKCTSNPCNLLRSVVVRTCLAYGSPSWGTPDGTLCRKPISQPLCHPKNTGACQGLRYLDVRDLKWKGRQTEIRFVSGISCAWFVCITKRRPRMAKRTCVQVYQN